MHIKTVSKQCQNSVNMILPCCLFVKVEVIVNFDSPFTGGSVKL